jgi:uncharacterized membrane protein YhaH (DUF805 family)
MEKAETSYNMFDWWKKVVLKNYANFTGRARRSEYWYFALTNLLLILPFYLLAIAGVTSDAPALSFLGIGIYGIVAIGTLIPGLAVAVRRLHDLNKSGWNYFFVLIPLVGPIILLVWFFTEGNSGENNYGPDPKNAHNPDFDFEQKP